MKHNFPDEEPCYSDKDYPPLSYEIIDIEGKLHKYELKSERYISYEEDSSVPEGKKCSSIIASLDIHQENLQNLVILGDVMIEEYQVAFHRDKDMVGFAKAKHHPDLLP